MTKSTSSIIKLLLLSISMVLLLSTASAKRSTKDDNGEEYYQTAVRVHKWANDKERFNLYAKAAQLGHPIAQFNLGMMYTNGKSVTIDHQQAVYWYQKSAAQKFSTAQYRLGEMHYLAKGGLSRNLNKAIELFSMAAEQNEAGAQLNLAMLYGSGEGVIADSKLAFYWLQRAMTYGNEEASVYQQILAKSQKKLFSEDQQLFYWTKIASELGIAEAKVKLASLYAVGKGVVEDDSIAPLKVNFEDLPDSKDSK
jgi:TPR repeat protein